jgi:hypothetical protein
MRYRDARLLKQGDAVVSIENNQTYYVKNIEVYGSVKTIRVNCVNATRDGDISFFHTELKGN